MGEEVEVKAALTNEKIQFTGVARSESGDHLRLQAAVGQWRGLHGP